MTTPIDRSDLDRVFDELLHHITHTFTSCNKTKPYIIVFGSYDKDVSISVWTGKVGVVASFEVTDIQLGYHHIESPPQHILDMVDMMML